LGEVQMKAATKRRSTQVPGQFLGYSLQTTRATMRLLQAPAGAFVSVEVLDDVAVASQGRKITLEQTKSTTSGNPVSDRSVDLWKTLANWVRAAESGQLDCTRTILEIFVSKQRQGKLVQSMAAANDSTAAASALREARDLLWGPPPTYPKRSRVGATLARHVDSVFGADRKIATAVIKQLSLAFGSGSSEADLIDAFRRTLTPEDMLEPVAHYALGWVKLRLDNCIERSLPAMIAVDDFRTELTAFLRKYDRFAILNSAAPGLPRTSLDIEDQNRIFVRQLDLIGADYDTKLSAANDYLRASIDRSVWASKGLVHRSSFNEFEDVLTRTWTAKKATANIQSIGQAPEVCGRLLYSECSLVQPLLEGRAVPPYFAPGCYHELSDKLTLGWHPDFKSKLARPSNEKDPQP
jgi:C-terminal domain 7 of the ABC-three component (ABC-3C) systems